MNEPHLAGVTPSLLVMANFYAMKGIGTYVAPKKSGYDYLKVEQSMPWVLDRNELMQSASTVKVSFLRGTEVIRWLEFQITLCGFGGQPIASLVE